MGEVSVPDGPRKTVEALPYDVLLHILDMLPAHDLISLLSCCRCLRSLVDQDSVWRNRSAQFGLRDITHFGGRSWYIVYTRLLHTYGPILGVWAGDQAYIGGLLDVKLHPGDGTSQGGIVIYSLHFRVLQPEELEEPEEPEAPEHIPIARIDFSQNHTLYEDARVLCYSSRSSPHSPVLTVCSSTCQALYLNTRQGECPHPEFPGTELLPWIDQTRYPRLPIRRIPSILDQRPEVSGRRPRIPIIFSAPSALQKPPAMSLSCRHRCPDKTRPLLGFDNSAPLPPRYYPLRRSPYPSADPAAADWHPTSLVGLWLGSHGPHGTEALFFNWDCAAAALRAWKVTGDENVPRGALSWEVSTESAYPVSQLPECAQSLGDLTQFRLFGGSGTVSARGFLCVLPCGLLMVFAYRDIPPGHTSALAFLWCSLSGKQTGSG